MKKNQNNLYFIAKSKIAIELSLFCRESEESRQLSEPKRLSELVAG